MGIWGGVILTIWTILPRKHRQMLEVCILWYTYLKLDHFIAHVFPYHFLIFWKFGKLDGSHSRHLLAVRTGNFMSYFVLAGVETVYFLVIKFWCYLWNYNFLWVRDESSKSVTRRFLKDMAILVKQLLVKVWHNGKVYHTSKFCFSSAFKLLFKVAGTSYVKER